MRADWSLPNSVPGLERSSAEFLRRCVSMDLETGRRGRLHEIGAIFDGRIFLRREIRDPQAALRELAEFCRDADFVLGHNLLHHDLPYVRSLLPDLSLLAKPIIDTLYLSALAFPENPYHRLVKDYKLVRDSISDPVADARLARGIFDDQWASLIEYRRTTPGLLDFYRFCFERGTLGHGQDGAGLAAVLGALGAAALDEADALNQWLTLAQTQACPAALRQAGSSALALPEHLPMLAYALAWLRVAGGNSVLPPWVRRRFPQLPALIRTLRETPCGSASCQYCHDNHDPTRKLRAFFGYPDFRAGDDGRSLQREVVTAGMGEQPLLAILPTGGGKSICYQIPALVRYQRRGALTIVISPLQALMKDQVDNLRGKTGTTAAAAVYGMLTPPERAEALDGVRMGDVGVLYISPEQLRNRSVRQALESREVGCWVFDEAHCLSKWGHDFRPDYLYAARFIRELAERQQAPIPPIACFTATAKRDVIDDIAEHFRKELDQELELFDGGAERDNLRFEVHPVNGAEKLSRAHGLLMERLGMPPAGGAVVYCAKRKNTEEAAEYLCKQGWTAEAFHAGLPAPEKRRIQDAFIAGEIPIICATNAFGMGIDKDNVRLVIHLDIPGSLENYLQEAGRAGRDEREAECILLYDAADVETQFMFGARSEIRDRDINQILRGLKRMRRGDVAEVVVTTGELLRSDQVHTSIDAADQTADTKVKTAVAWLERAGFLERNENQTRVFQGRPAFHSMEEAKTRLDKLNLAEWKRRQWETILEILMNADPDEGITADDIAGRPDVVSDQDRKDGRELSDSQRVLHILHQMTEAGLISEGLQLTAFIRPAGKGNARVILERVCAIEKAMLAAMREAAPDAGSGDWQHISPRVINQRLVDGGLTDSNPQVLLQLLESLSQDGRGLAGRRGSLDLRYLSQDIYQVKLHRDWPALIEVAERRHAIAQALLSALYQKIPEDQRASQSELLVEFSSQDLAQALKADLAMAAEIRDELAAIDRGLMFLHEQKAIILQRGLAVFRQAMTIRLLPAAHGRRYTKGDYAPLANHYQERTYQVHVMNEYARLGLETINRAMRLVADYFTLDKRNFTRRYFPGREDMLKRATGEESFRRIVESLNNPVQQAIVASPTDANALILAGPGSGKTRTVVHRCAYLLRVERILPSAILILCFNHNAKLTLRKRLWELVGKDAAGVAILTYHGLAMRLTGASFAGRAEGGGQALAFDQLIPEAIQLLNGEKDLPGLAADELRDRLLAGYRHILVDEYQDIDAQQYELISVIAGRTQADPDTKARILAVGDDDQSIYAFRHANVRFIRQFHDDYQAQVHYLVENYRSTGHIIDAANALIAHNRDRMKSDHPIRINSSRHRAAAGGAWAERDALAQGRVQLLQVADAHAQALAVVQEMRRLKALSPTTDWRDFAVLARTRQEELTACRAALEAEGIPVSWPLERGAEGGGDIPLHRVREFAAVIERLRDETALLTATVLRELAHQWLGDGGGDWAVLLFELLDDYREETGDAELPAQHFIEFLFEALAEQRRERRLGRGVFLSTAHAAKGMEFPHVFVLGGHWTHGRDAAEAEEERRLYYVAITRAEETLALFERRDFANPHTPLLQGEFLYRRRLEPAGPAMERSRRYALLGMRELNLGYAGAFPTGAEIYRALAALQVDDPVALASAEGKSGTVVRLLDQQGRVVAQLAGRAAAEWLPRLPHVISARVVAVVRRRIEDEGEGFRERVRCDRWEVPLVEVTYENASNGLCDPF